jgi:hypothetical protein
MATVTGETAMGPGQVIIGHVFGGPLVSSDSSNTVSTTASSVTLTAGKIYRLVSDVDCYFYFGAAGGSACTADIGSLLVEKVPEIFRAPDAKGTLYLLGTASGTVWVSEMGV